MARPLSCPETALHRDVLYSHRMLRSQQLQDDFLCSVIGQLLNLQIDAEWYESLEDFTPRH